MTLRPRFIRGIRDKLIVAFSALVAAIAIFVFVFYPARLERQALRATVAKAEVIREMTAYSVATGLLFDDRAAVAEVLVGADVEDVSYLIVWDEDGGLVAAHGAVTVPSGPPLLRPEGEITDDGRTYVSTTPVLSGTRRVGTLRVGVSLASLRAEAASIRRIGALVGALIFVIGILVIFAISTFITRPLTAVASTVNRIAAGDLTLRATETADVEVAQLVRAFNRMIDTLVGTQGELAVMNAELESRVDARTAELRSAVEEQRRSQAALKISEGEARKTSTLLQALIDGAPQAIVVTDSDWLVTLWSQGAERMFGWRESEVLGHLQPYLPADGSGDVPRHRSAEWLATPSGPREVTRVRRDGTVFSALLGVGVMRDQDQRVTGFIDFFTDLTERKQLEEQLRQSQKLDAMGRFAGGIAHDFNNILTIITTCSELMLKGPRTDEDRAYLEHISGAAARAAALTSQLLTFTRQQIVQLRVVDVATVVRNFEPMLRRVLPANINFTTDFDTAGGSVIADASQLEQIVMNLVVNAADAMAQGGELRIETHHLGARAGALEGETIPAGPCTVLSVKDTGTGIEPEAVAKIFEPFFTTKGVGKGTGLGLSTTYGIVAGMGGTIDVHSTAGCGTTFEIFLPETAERASVGAALDDSPSLGIAAGRRSTVLLVEDESDVRGVVSSSLQSAGYEVWEASSGEQALGIVAERGEQLAAVVTDVMMPGMNGRVLAENIGALYPQLGVVFVSGYAEKIVEGTIIHDAQHAFLQKPFAGAQLAAAIRRVSPQRRSSDA